MTHGKTLLERLQAPGIEELILWLAVLAGLICVFAYVAQQLRGKPLQQEPEDEDLLENFRLAHTQGGLSDSEFRTIETTLAERSKTELKDTRETG